MPCEHWVSVAHNGFRESMQPDNLCEEGPGNRTCCIRVTKGDEMRKLGEPVNHSQDDAFSMNFGQVFNEVH